MQKLVLKATGYTNAVLTDKGKLVTDDSTTIGTLVNYDNTNRVWYINTPNTIAIDSVMAIISGTGAGAAYAASTLFIDEYADIDLVKDRLLIQLNDDQYNDALHTAVEEATQIVDRLLFYYTESLDDDDPYNPIFWKTNMPDTVPPDIQYITADFATSIFKRRMTPDETRIRGAFAPAGEQDEMDVQGWYGQAYKKLQLFIRSVYIKPTFELIQSGSGIFNYTRKNIS